MLERRPTLIVLFAFAATLTALAVAGVTAWARCGGESDCSLDLALAIVAFAPAALLGALTLLLMRTKVDVRWLANVVLAIAVAIAVLPLAAFLLRNVWFLLLFALLTAVAVLLVLWGERDFLELMQREPREPAQAPEEPPAARPALPTPQPEPFAAQPAQPLLSASATQMMAVLEGLATTNAAIVDLCERLPPTERAKTRRDDRPSTAAGRF